MIKMVKQKENKTKLYILIIVAIFGVIYALIGISQGFNPFSEKEINATISPEDICRINYIEDLQELDYCISKILVKSTNVEQDIKEIDNCDIQLSINTLDYSFFCNKVLEEQLINFYDEKSKIYSD